MNTNYKIEALFWRLAPHVAAVLLSVLFVSLGLWQLGRAAEKSAMQDLFEQAGEYTPLTDGMTVQDFQRIGVAGRFLGDRQFLIDNIVLDGRLGYYVITPFEYASDKPLLIVNRGWIEAGPERTTLPDISVGGDAMQLRGRAGRLPRVGIHPGEAISDGTEWPKLATYPLLSDLAGALGRDVLPFVMLLDPDANETLIRKWQPRTQGPMMHYGYAFQWFAMAAAVLGILIWQVRKARK